MAAASIWPTQGEEGVEQSVRLALGELDSAPALQRFLLGFMAKPGRLFGPTEPQAPKFVLQTAAALGADSAEAAWGAAAVEFTIVAADVADDLADGDLAADPEVTIRAPSAALALGWLGQYCCARAAERVGLKRANRIALLLSTGALAACTGQDLDMLLEAELEVSEDRAAAASWRKSGSLAAMACTVGAACATDSLDIIEAAGRFGAHAGMVAQLVNDIDGIVKGERHASADIARRKKTLPVAYALNCAREEGIVHLLDWYGRTSGDTPRQHKLVAHTIRNLGALHYTWAVAEVHRSRAMQALHALETLSGRASTRQLEGLVSPLGPR